MFALGYFELHGQAGATGSVPRSVRTWRERTDACASSEELAPVVALLPFLIALAQFIAVVIIYPKHDRLISQFHMPWVPYTAIAGAPAYVHCAAMMRGHHDPRIVDSRVSWLEAMECCAVALIHSIRHEAARHRSPWRFGGVAMHTIGRQ